MGKFSLRLITNYSVRRKFCSECIFPAEYYLVSAPSQNTLQRRESRRRLCGNHAGMAAKALGIELPKEA